MTYIHACEADHCLRQDGLRSPSRRAEARLIQRRPDHWRADCDHPWDCKRHRIHHAHVACARAAGEMV